MNGYTIDSLHFGLFSVEIEHRRDVWSPRKLCALKWFPIESGPPLVGWVIRSVFASMM
jgi:hypothetical protein